MDTVDGLGASVRREDELAVLVLLATDVTGEGDPLAVRRPLWLGVTPDSLGNRRDAGRLRLRDPGAGRRDDPDALEGRIVAPVGLDREGVAVARIGRVTEEGVARGELLGVAPVPVHRVDLHAVGSIAVEGNRAAVRRPVGEDRVVV